MPYLRVPDTCFSVSVSHLPVLLNQLVDLLHLHLVKPHKGAVERLIVLCQIRLRRLDHHKVDGAHLVLLLHVFILFLREVVSKLRQNRESEKVGSARAISLIESILPCLPGNVSIATREAGHSRNAQNIIRMICMPNSPPA